MPIIRSFPNSIDSVTAGEHDECKRYDFAVANEY